MDLILPPRTPATSSRTGFNNNNNINDENGFTPGIGLKDGRKYQQQQQQPKTIENLKTAPRRAALGELTNNKQNTGTKLRNGISTTGLLPSQQKLNNNNTVLKPTTTINKKLSVKFVDFDIDTCTRMSNHVEENKYRDENVEVLMNKLKTPKTYFDSCYPPQTTITDEDLELQQPQWEVTNFLEEDNIVVQNDHFGIPGGLETL
jgi:hypothetical protein